MKLALFLVYLLGSTLRPVIPVIPAVKTATEVVSFGIDVFSFFDSLFSDDEVQSTPAPVDYDRIINSISERIKLSTETVVFKIELQLYISELRDIALTTKQLLSKMQDIITADSNEERDEYRRRFREHFGRHKIVIYRIRILLTFSVEVSGTSNTLLSLITNEFKCGISQLEEFQNYYMSLVSDVVALDLLSEKLEEQSLYNDTLASWKDAADSLLKEMEQQKDTCKAKFSELIKNDFDQISDPSQLFKNNQNRYNYRATDVLFVNGSYCVWSLKNYSNILQKRHEEAATFVLINAKEHQAGNCSKVGYPEKIASKAKFKDCFKDVDKIISYFDVLGSDLIFWGKFPTKQTDGYELFFDQDSYATMVDGIEYTTLFYTRAQSEGINSTLTSDDFDVLYSEENQVSSGSDLSLDVGLFFMMLASLYFLYKKGYLN